MCRSHSLDERLLACNDHVEVRQVKFHPGSKTGTHIIVLTSDNVIRLYNVENSEAIAVTAFAVGRQPQGFIGGTKSSFLEALGDTAVDFDFAPPEIMQKNMIIAQQTQTTTILAKTDDSLVNESKTEYTLIKSGSTTIVKG